MSERIRSEVMVLVAGACLGPRPANEITEAQWDDFLARCEVEAERPIPEEAPSETLDTGFATAEDPVDVEPEDPVDVEPEAPVDEQQAVTEPVSDEEPEDDTEGAPDDNPASETSEIAPEPTEGTEATPEG